MGLGGNLAGPSTAPTSDVGVVAQVTGINGTVVGTTTLLTVPTGRTFVPLAAVLRVTAAVGVTAVGTAGIGVAAGEDDVFASIALTALDAVDELFTFANDNRTSKVGTAGQVIRLGIDVAYTATTLTLTAELIGYYL